MSFSATFRKHLEITEDIYLSVSGGFPSVWVSTRRRKLELHTPQQWGPAESRALWDALRGGGTTWVVTSAPEAPSDNCFLLLQPRRQSVST